jgi:hypothetical protein
MHIEQKQVKGRNGKSMYQKTLSTKPVILNTLKEAGI